MAPDSTNVALAPKYNWTGIWQRLQYCKISLNRGWYFVRKFFTVVSGGRRARCVLRGDVFATKLVSYIGKYLALECECDVVMIVIFSFD